MAEIVIALTLVAFLALACMTLECVMRFGFWNAWAVFCWCIAMGFAWLLTGDVFSHALEFPQLAQAPLRSGVFRSIVLLGAFQWLVRQPEWRQG